jgi:hypothetical protein
MHVTETNRIEGPGVELRVHDLAKELGVTSKEMLAWSATNTMEANWHIGVARNCIFVIVLSSKIIHCVAFADELVVATSPYCLAYSEDVRFRIRPRQ